MSVGQMELIAREVAGVEPRTAEEWANIFKSLWTQDLYGTLKNGMLMVKFHDEWYESNKRGEGGWNKICQDIIGVRDSTYYLYRRIYVYFAARPDLLEEHWGLWPRDAQALVSVIRALEVMPEDASAVTRHMSLDMTRDAASALFEKVNAYRKRQIGEGGGVEDEEGDEEQVVTAAREAGQRSRLEEVKEVRRQVIEAMAADDRLRVLLEIWLDAREMWDQVDTWTNSIGWLGLEVMLKLLWKRTDNQ